MRRLGPIFIAIVLIGCSQRQAPPAVTPASHAERIERRLIAPDYAKPIPADHATLQDRLAYWHVPGVSIAVINNGKVEWARGYGIADLQTGRQVDEHTLFHGASLSKMVNAVTVLCFVQQGRLDLDKPVNEQLKSWQLPASEFTRTTPITLRRLLSHTAGMSMQYFGLGFSATQPAVPLLDVLNGKPPATQPVKVEEQPGKRFHYSGGAIAISQLMLEEASGGEPYPRIVQKTVFGPLGMTESTFEQKLPAEIEARTAPGFKAGKRVNGPERTYPAMSGAGLWTTPQDFCKLIIEIQRAATNQRANILSPGAAEVMLTPYVENQKNASGLKSTVGIGCFLAGSAKARNGTFYHAGSHAGYACYAIGRIDAGQGVVVMTNGDDAFDLIAEIVQTVGAEYRWPDYHFVPPPRAAKAATTTSPAQGK
jgi:CubicO group peptidase (beta-lactamase class C family)